jgi:hypothetical protein
MFMLDYDKMLLFDAEDLAEGGILRAYQLDNARVSSDLNGEILIYEDEKCLIL